MTRSYVARARLRVHAARALLVALVSVVAASCSDEREMPLSPEGARLESSGTYPPIVDPSVRTTPFLLNKEGHTVWFQLTNTASIARSYWFGAGVGGGVLQLVKTPDPVTVPAGASRWMPVEISVNSDAADGAQGVVYFAAHDSEGDSYGLASTSLAVEVNTSRPAVGFISPQDYRVRANGQTVRSVYPGEIKHLRLWVRNQSGATENVCARWLTDEGGAGQVEMPRSNTCLVVPPNHAGEMNFAYRVKATATPGVIDRHTVVVYTTSNPSVLTYGYLRTQTVSAPTQSATRQFFGWTHYDDTAAKRAFADTFGVVIQAQTAKLTENYQEYFGIARGSTVWGSLDKTTYQQYAQANPGRIWIVGDEPDQPNSVRIEASHYADLYHEFVTDIRAADPSARFSPAGIAQTKGNGVSGTHGTTYAQEFIDAYRAKHYQDPPVEEWRFHFLNTTGALTLDDLKAEIGPAAQWSMERGGRMVLGSFGGFDMESTMNLVKDQSTWVPASAVGWIVTAGFWNYDYFEVAPFGTLIVAPDDRRLTAQGCTFVRVSQNRIPSGCS